jgi:hypothetical protein
MSMSGSIVIDLLTYTLRALMFWQSNFGAAICPEQSLTSKCSVLSAVSRSTKFGASLKAGAVTRRYHSAFSSAMNASRSAPRSLLTR